jgi:RNA recognition motif-containing protein
MKSDIIFSNAFILMGEVTILYVGNLSDESNELILARVFSQYGEIEYVKYMSISNEDDKSRKKNFAYIKFY